MTFIALGIIVLVGLICGPQFWIRRTMARHAGERADFPGTGGELARHLLDEAGLAAVKVEIVGSGDHYSPIDKAVRLSKSNFEGRSVTAIAVAAHEASHAMQDTQGYAPLRLRQELSGYGIVIERIDSVLLLATPVVFALTRSPAILVFELIIGLGILASTIILHDSADRIRCKLQARLANAQRLHSFRRHDGRPPGFARGRLHLCRLSARQPDRCDEPFYPL